MFKNIYVLLFLFIHFSNCLYGQLHESSLQKVHRYCYKIESQDWYKNQKQLWANEINKDPFNEESWYNYYFSTRYASMGIDNYERKVLLDSVAEKIGQAIPKSYLYPYIKYYNGDRKIEYLDKAYQINPNCTDLYWEYIQYYDTEGNYASKKTFCEKLYLSKQIISSLFAYSNNVLNSLENNSILLTNGDNDTYPLWILQEVKNVRPDVMVLNAHALFVLRDYMKMKFGERNIDIDFSILPKENENISTFIKQLIFLIKNKYPEISINIVPTMDYDSIKEIESNLYNTGITFLYSNSTINAITLIQKNIEQKMQIDYLENDWYNENHISRTIVDELNMNYVPAFLELSKMYGSLGLTEKADYWKKKSILLAKRTNDQDLLKKIEETKY